MDSNADVKLALEEMRLNMQSALASSDVLDKKLASLLVAVVVAAVICATFHIEWFTFPLVVPGSLCLLAIVLAFAVRPQKYNRAIASDWEALSESVFDKSERDAILSLLSGYVDQIQHNRKINQQEAMIFQFCLTAFAIIGFGLILT